MYMVLDSMKDLGYQPDIDLFLFPYDWRLSARSNAAFLAEFIERRPELRGQRFDIIAVDF
jgi:hypothetical protein